MNLYHIDTVDGPEECFMWAPSHDAAFYAAVCTNAMRHVQVGDVRVRRVFAFSAFERFIPWRRDTSKAHEAVMKQQ